MQLFVRAFVTLSFLSLQVLARHNRIIRPRPGSHRGSGLGGGGHFPFPVQQSITTTVSIASSAASAPLETSLAQIPSQTSITTTSESAPTETSVAPIPLQTSLTTSSKSTPTGAALAPAPTESLSSAYITLHNSFRENYAASPLAWSNSLASAAQQWASNCQYGHSQLPYGENIAAGTGGNFTPHDAFNMWASEAPQYNSTDPVPSHFTQVVWKQTTHVGCAMANCPGLLGGSSTAQYFVCEYDPAGNIIGNFTKNVQ